MCAKALTKTLMVIKYSGIVLLLCILGGFDVCDSLWRPAGGTSSLFIFNSARHYYTSIVNCSRINTAVCVFVFLVPHCATQIQMEIHMLSWAHSLFLYLRLQTFNLNQLFLHDQSN